MPLKEVVGWQAIMVKTKAPKSAKSNPHKHLQARVSFLQRASEYLATQQARQTEESGGSAAVSESARNNGASRHMTAQCKGVSRKAQIRMSQDAKRSMCKRCETQLVLGQSSEEHVENLSRNGAKPWANVLVLTCLTCKAVKRYPIGAARTSKRKDRQSKREDALQQVAMLDAPGHEAE
jgi:ribonuclease P protein subunit RPR2